MRKTLWVLALCATPIRAQALHEPLTFEEIEQRSLADPSVLDRKEATARLTTEIESSSRYALEGATLEADLGPRRMEDDDLDPNVTARIALPLLSGGSRRTVASDRLLASGPDLAFAATVESRLRLRLRYLEAWLAQESQDLLRRQAEALDQALSSVRERVGAGADAPYEAALIEGEILRARSELDAGRLRRGEAWADLRVLARLPVEPIRLASLEQPRLDLPADLAARFEAGVLKRAVAAGGALGQAMLDFENARRSSRWTVTGAVGREGDESFVTAGAAYRFAKRGESVALAAERRAAAEALTRRSESETDRLATRFEVARDRAAHFGPIVPPESFDESLAALAIRLALGKDRPSEILPVRRQLLEAQAVALERIRDAHALAAELDALTSGGTK